MEILACVAIIVSCVSTVVHTIITYKKAKEPPKDPVWDAALKIITSSQSSMCDADEFANVYEELAAFKSNGCSLGSSKTLSSLKEKMFNKKTNKHAE